MSSNRKIMEIKLKLKYLFLVIIFIPLTPVNSASCLADISHEVLFNYNDSSTCPTWFYSNISNKCQCHCDNGHGNNILCDNKKMASAMQVGSCVTEDSNSGDIYVGSCIYTPNFEESYYILPDNLTNFSLCNKFHRTGILCGECEKGLRPPVFSYNLTCMDCPNGNENWWKFILVGFVPITLFYLFILTFNINVTSSLLHDVVLFSQMVSLPQFVQVLFLVIEDHPTILTLAKIFLLMYSIWNLDIFRSLFSNICLNVDTL